MNYFLISTLLLIGASGIIAQVVILRELLVSYFGNELTLGIILANWLALEALGAFLSGKFVAKRRNGVAVFIILQLAFSIALPLSVYSARAFKSFSGIAFGEGIGLAAIILSSFLIILPLGFCHGALFSASCQVFSDIKRQPRGAIGTVYTFETLGTLLGGVILTYFFIPFLDSFQMVFIVSILNILICLFFLKYIPGIRSRAIIVFSAISFLSPFLIIGPARLQRDSVNKQYMPATVLDYRNSVYGNVAVTETQSQRTFFYNGMPIITTPYPDITFVEEFGHLALLFHPNPKNILVISGGAGGLIDEILKHPVSKLDYAELDPLIIKMLREFPSEMTGRELADPRVNIINTDGRFFLSRTGNEYDVVLIGISKPADLSVNRMFTEEFFKTVKRRLRPGGIMGVWLPGSLSYLSPTVRDINFSVMNAIKRSYANLRLIPGDYNLIFASDSQAIMSVNAESLANRLARDNIKTRILNDSYLKYRLDRRWLEWFEQSSRGATLKINKDFSPFALFLTLAFWNQQFAPKTAYIFETLKDLNLFTIFTPLAIMTLALYGFLFRKKPGAAKFAVAYSIFTTGFFGMLMSLLLIFSFQIFYGYLYHKIGLLMAILMAGIAAGSAIMNKKMEFKSYGAGLLLKIEILIIAFSYFSALVISRWNINSDHTLLIFVAMFFISGALTGIEFPLGARLFSQDQTKIGATSGILYLSDLLGGWLAGIMGGIILLPVLGLFNSCMLIILAKILSVFLLTHAFRGTLFTFPTV